MNIEMVGKMKVQMIEFQSHGDDRGALIALEEYINIPFEVKRVYFMYDTKPGVHRGMHAHKTLKQVLFCPCGECTIKLDDGNEVKEVRLKRPTEGLVIESSIWREMYDFLPGTVLMVLASDYYNETDYIRDYSEFLKYIADAKR